MDEIKEFKKKMSKDGRSYRWFHRNYLNGITYPYFIIQLNEPDRIHEGVKNAIKKYLDEI
jgi:hypothetical protein